jgi:aminoglycoside phosphotransferase (APT) family kinase protein
LLDALPAGFDRARGVIAALIGTGMPVDGDPIRRLDDLQRGSAAERSLETLRCVYAALKGIVETVTLPALGLQRGSPAGRPAAREDPVLAALRAFAQWERDLLSRHLEPPPAAAKEPLVADGFTLEKLESFLRVCLPDEPVVSNFEPLAGGMSSKRMYRFNLQHASGTFDELVARYAPTEPLIDIACFDLRREYALVKTLFESGYPVPEPLWSGRDCPGLAGSFYIMRKVEGTASGGLFSGGTIPDSALLDMAERLATLHALPLGRFADFIDEHEEASIYACTAADGTRRSLARLISAWNAASRTPAPTEVYLLAWALANIPATDEPASLLHGDFTPHNCLFEKGRLTSVLDWECAEFGDPAADLAYLRPHIAARMNWDRFMARYEQSGGRAVGEERLRYFANFFHLRTLVCCNIVATAVEQGHSREILALNVDYEYLPKVMQICVDATLD